MTYLKAKLSRPAAKYGLLAICSGLWTFGLIGGFYSSAATMKYLLMSLLIGAVAML